MWLKSRIFLVFYWLGSNSMSIIAIYLDCLILLEIEDWDAKSPRYSESSSFCWVIYSSFSAINSIALDLYAICFWDYSIFIDDFLEINSFLWMSLLDIILRFFYCKDSWCWEAFFWFESRETAAIRSGDIGGKLPLDESLLNSESFLA